MKRLLYAALALCMLCAVAACGARVDTAEWRCLRFEELGVAVPVPDDFARDGDAEAYYRGQGADVELTVVMLDELYPDTERLAAQAGEGAEIVAVGGAALVRLPSEERSAVYDLIGARGDTFRLRIAVSEALSDRRAARLLHAVCDDVRGASDISGDAADVRAAAMAPPDALVLVNRRSALPEGWADALDLAETTNGRGERLTVERGVCKAFFALQHSLAAEGVNVDLAAAYGADGEHTTGLALDLYPLSADDWSRARDRLAAHGFIERYTEDGTYYTGHAAEPYHIRYVGQEAAGEIAARGITLEEYLGTLPAALDYLALVNAHNALPEGWEDALELAHMINRHGEDVAVERIAYDAYCGLRDALASEGVHLDINSAYRSVAAQRALAESYTRKYGADYVRTYVAVPGYSEHHTGLAIDLYLESVDVWAKIHAHLAEFGFILRYPEGKEAITGYGYEPWHIRFVGVEAAREIAERGVTLEEYLGTA